LDFPQFNHALLMETDTIYNLLYDGEIKMCVCVNAPAVRYEHAHML